MEKARLSASRIPLNMAITSFSGLRACEEKGDFFLGEAADAPGFFNAAGIDSPGLSSAPAIGVLLAGQIAEKLHASRRTEFHGQRKDIPCVATSTPEEIAALIASDPAYGNVICRCETVTEGEIINAIRRPLGARSLDGVKAPYPRGYGTLPVRLLLSQSHGDSGERAGRIPSHSDEIRRQLPASDRNDKGSDRHSFHRKEKRT